MWMIPKITETWESHIHTHTHTHTHTQKQTKPFAFKHDLLQRLQVWPCKQSHATTQHTQVWKKVVIRNSPCLGHADHLRCRTPQGTQSHEHVWWYGRAWGHQRWLGKWKCPASLMMPVPVSCFHPRLGLTFLTLLGLAPALYGSLT